MSFIRLAFPALMVAAGCLLKACSSGDRSDFTHDGGGVDGDGSVSGDLLAEYRNLCGGLVNRFGGLLGCGVAANQDIVVGDCTAVLNEPGTADIPALLQNGTCQVNVYWTVDTDPFGITECGALLTLPAVENNAAGGGVNDSITGLENISAEINDREEVPLGCETVSI